SVNQRNIALYLNTFSRQSDYPFDVIFAFRRQEHNHFTALRLTNIIDQFIDDHLLCVVKIRQHRVAVYDEWIERQPAYQEHNCSGYEQRLNPFEDFILNARWLICHASSPSVNNRGLINIKLNGYL